MACLHAVHHDILPGTLTSVLGEISPHLTGTLTSVPREISPHLADTLTSVPGEISPHLAVEDLGGDERVLAFRHSVRMRSQHELTQVIARYHQQQHWRQKQTACLYFALQGTLCQRFTGASTVFRSGPKLYIARMSHVRKFSTMTEQHVPLAYLLASSSISS